MKKLLLMAIVILSAVVSQVEARCCSNIVYETPYELVYRDTSCGCRSCGC